MGRYDITQDDILNSLKKKPMDSLELADHMRKSLTVVARMCNDMREEGIISLIDLPGNVSKKYSLPE